MKYNDILKAVTVRITTKGDFKGTGIIYKPKDGDSLYIFTAKHCVYGPTFDNNAKRKHIKIDKIILSEGKDSYTLKKGDRIVVDEEEDIAAIIIHNTSFPEFENIPTINLATVDDHGGYIRFKGYPFLTNTKDQKSGEGNLHTNDLGDNKFQVEPDKSFLKYYDKSNVIGVSKGFSGCGICGQINNEVYLQGVVSKFDLAIGFECVSLTGFVSAKLPALRLFNLKVERLLPDTLFQGTLKQMLRQLKPRYQELNFSLPIEDYFDQFVCNDKYRDEVKKRLNGPLQTLSNLQADKNGRGKLFLRIYGGDNLQNRTGVNKSFQVAYDELIVDVMNISGQINTLYNDFENELSWQVVSNSINNLSDGLYRYSQSARTQIGIDGKTRTTRTSELKDIRQLNGDLQKISNELAGLKLFLSNQRFVSKKYLLIKGAAGNGKSQLLGFIANKRQEQDIPSILVLGQSLSSYQDIWSQINKRFCQKSVSDTEFLETLNLKGELLGHPVILFIDAINEGKGIRLWNTGFNNFIDAVMPYRYIKVVLSYRNSYENALFKNIEYDTAAIVEHRGFEGVEKQAVYFFFTDAGLTVPVLPYYSKQFGNPLFLRLFVLLYKNSNGKIDLHSWLGTMYVFKNFFHYINHELGQRKFHYDADKLDIVGLAIKKFVKTQLKRRLIYLDYHTAYKRVEKAVRLFIKGKGFFEALISEGLFYENRYPVDEYDDELGVDFSYQKLGEYIKVQYLLKEIPEADLPTAINPNGMLFFMDEQSEENEDYQGFIEAVTIMVPYYFGKEIFDIWPNLLERADIIRAFITALRDRSSITITDKTKEYLKAILNLHKAIINDFWTDVLNYSFQPANALNTAFLHDYLLNMPLPERDAGWGVFIGNNYDDRNTISPVSSIINWAFNYRENKIMDSGSIAAIGKTLFWFFGSNNRHLRDHATKAAIYLFTDNLKELKSVMADFKSVNDPYIIQRIYAVVFGSIVRNGKASAIAELTGYVYETIFNKDQIIADILLRDYARLAVEYGIFRGVHIPEPSKIRPPYKSEKLPDAPSDAVVENYPVELGYNDNAGYAGIQSILSSMITEYGSRGYMYGDFGRYTFGYAVKHWKSYPESLLSNLAIEMIVHDLGYNHALSEIDKNIKSSGRSAARIERIGKKYQWIAFYQILARLSDNYKFYDSSSIHSKETTFSGAWEPNVRDIDPTMMMTGTRETPDAPWWSDYKYQIFEEPLIDWLKNESDLPDPRKMIELKDHKGVEWLVLESHHTWDAEEAKNGNKQLWYQLRSYLVKKDKQEAIVKWMSKQNLMGRWMPESQSRTELYLREYFWSPAVVDFMTPYYGNEVWQDLRGEKGGRKIGEVSVSSLEYLWEKQIDNSQEESTSLLLPNQLLFEILKLRPSLVDGHFENEAGLLIAFDPAAIYDTPSCLIVRKEELMANLKEAGLDIFWTGLGEKLNTGSYDRNNPELFQKLQISDVVFFRNGILTSSKLAVADPVR